MQFLFFLSTILLTGIVSSVVTVYLLHRYIPGYKFKVENTSPHTSKTEDLGAPAEYKKVSTESKSKNRSITPNILTQVLGFIKILLAASITSISILSALVLSIFRFIIISFTRVLSSLYKYAILLIDVLMALPLAGILYVYRNSIKKITGYLNIVIRGVISTGFGVVSFVAVFLTKLKKTLLSINIFRSKSLDSKVVTEHIQEPQDKVITKEIFPQSSFINVESIEKKDVLSRAGRYHFLLEALTSILFAVLILAPFISKAQQTSPGYFFFYHTAVLIFGSYILLRHHSPRIFWAIGILEWVSVFFWFFNWYGVEHLFSASVFLTIFVLIYGLSSYMWYGLEDHEYTYIEYALFVLHPFLYMSAIYLLLVGGYKYVVSVLFISIAAVYGYFARSLYINNKTKKLFYICLSVTAIATLSFLALIFEGLLLLLMLTLLAISILSLSNHYQLRTTLYVLPVLVYLSGYALASTNTADKYIFLLNSRFLSYILSSATLTFVSMYIYKIYTRNSEPVYRYAYNAILLVETILLSIGVTLEILDIKEYTSFFTNVSEPVVLTSFYIAYGVILFVIGKKYYLRTLYLASICISIYAVIYCLRTFLF